MRPPRVEAGVATLTESAMLAVDSIRTQPARSILAIVGIVIGIVTVVLVASVLANLRAGTYRIACMIQIGEQGSTVAHYQQGMWTDLVVEQ